MQSKRDAPGAYYLSLSLETLPNGGCVRASSSHVIMYGLTLHGWRYRLDQIAITVQHRYVSQTGREIESVECIHTWSR